MSSDGRRDRIAELNRQTENELQAILLQDPTNYDANMGMAELKKSPGTINEYITYLNAALNSRDIAENKVNDLQENIERENNFAQLLTSSDSGAVSEVDSEIPPLLKNVLGHDFSNVYPDSKKAVKAYLYATLCERRCDYLTESVSQAASAGGGGTP
jgi:predicted SprT family Zn-dependent metalloprotease